ncbi:MAG: hypothetical protein Q7R53_01935 [bacterium]|nr:hypothetical protein [bacterium]
MVFNRSRNDRPGGGFRSRPSFGGRPKFGDRGDRGPVEMHKAVCDDCKKECEVPFRPTQGKPIFCSNCFENKNGASDSRRFSNKGGQASGWEDRQMFEAVCADCGKNCKVPFKPSGEKPVFCSNCFGDKKNAGGNVGGRDKFEELNAKLDKILSLLSPSPVVPIEEIKKPVKKAAKKTKTKETTSVKEE